MKDCNLYVIIDRKAGKNRDLTDIAHKTILGGADIIQLRDKLSSSREIIQQAKSIKQICTKYKKLFIINDRVDIAACIDSDGVHLGQDDIPVEDARKIFPPRKLIGVSTHSIDQAKAAQQAGADYIGVGPVFSTPTKPDYKSVGLDLVKWASENIQIPFVAIGGIDINNIDDVLNAGAKNIAVVRAVCAAEDVRGAAFQLKEKIINSGKNLDLVD